MDFFNFWKRMVGFCAMDITSRFSYLMYSLYELQEIQKTHFSWMSVNGIYSTVHDIFKDWIQKVNKNFPKSETKSPLQLWVNPIVWRESQKHFLSGIATCQNRPRIMAKPTLVENWLDIPWCHIKFFENLPRRHTTIPSLTMPMAFYMGLCPEYTKVYSPLHLYKGI